MPKHENFLRQKSTHRIAANRKGGIQPLLLIGRRILHDTRVFITLNFLQLFINQITVVIDIANIVRPKVIVESFVFQELITSYV
jgi:hypothetical protein